VSTPNILARELEEGPLLCCKTGARSVANNQQVPLSVNFGDVGISGVHWELSGKFNFGVTSSHRTLDLFINLKADSWVSVIRVERDSRHLVWGPVRWKWGGFFRHFFDRCSRYSICIADHRYPLGSSAHCFYLTTGFKCISFISYANWCGTQQVHIWTRL
jgi:hypothetical protein